MAFRRIGLQLARLSRAVPSYVTTFPAQARHAVDPLWRRTVRVTVVIVGLALFLILQLSLANGINRGEWIMMSSTLSALVLVLLAFVYPAQMFAVWLVVTPVATLLFRLDFGTDMPALTFDRVVLNTLALSLIIRGLASKQKVKRLRVGEVLLILFPLYLGLMTFFTYHPSMPNTLVLIMARGGDFAVIYFVARGCMRNISDVTRALWALLILVAYVAILGILDQVTGTWVVFKLIGTDAQLITQGGSEAGRSAGPFKGPFDLAVVLGVLSMIVFHVGNSTPVRWLRIFCFLLIPTCLLAWVYTYSRSTYPVLIMCILVMPLIARSNRVRYSILAVTFIIAAAITVPIMLQKASIRDRFLNPTNARVRIATDVAMFNMFKAHPLFGIGLGNALNNMSRYAQSYHGVAGFEIWADFGSPSAKTAMSRQFGPHNTQFVILSEHGLIGAVLYFGACFAFLIHLWRARGRMPRSGLLSSDLYAIVAISSFTFVTITSSGGFYDSTRFCLVLMWVLIAILLKAFDIQQFTNTSNVQCKEYSLER